MTESDKKLGDINVSMGDDNRVGHIGHVMEPPAPELKLLGWHGRENLDGSFTTEFDLQIIAPNPPANLYVETRAPGILSIELLPQRTGMVVTGHTGIRPDFAFTNLQHPYGKNRLVVRTQGKVPIEFEYKFE